MKKCVESPTRFNSFLYFTVFAANLSTFTVGVAFAWSSPAIPRLNGLIDNENNPLKEKLTQSEESWIASLLPLGAAVSAFISGYSLDKFGRKATLLASSTPNIAGFACCAFATEVYVFYLGRFLCGLGSGAVFTVLPIYVGELSESKNRGLLGCILVLHITVGNLFVYVTAPYCTITFLSLLNVFPPFLFLIVFGFYAPESPYFFLAKNQPENARTALLKLRYNSVEIVERELVVIEKNVAESYSKSRSLIEFVNDKGLSKGLKLTTGLVFFQQFSGVNVIFFYMQSIFEEANTGISSDLCTIFVGIVQCLASIVASVTVDKFGRRILLLVSSLGMVLSQISFSIYFYFKNHSFDVETVNYMPIICIILFVLTYTLGFGPIAFAMTGEVFPPHAKSTASTLTVFVCLMSIFCVTTIFPYLSACIGIDITFGLLAAICFIAGCFVYFFVPETKGKTLQEIEEMLRKK